MIYEPKTRKKSRFWESEWQNIIKETPQKYTQKTPYTQRAKSFNKIVDLATEK